MRNLITLYRDPNAPPGGGGNNPPPPAAGAITSEALGALSGDAFRNLLPETTRNAGYMKDVNNFGDFIKKFDGAQALIGQRTTPADNAPPEQWNAWFQQIGRPDKAEEYGVPAIEGVPEEYITKAGEVGMLQKVLHQGGVNKTMANSIMSNLIKTIYTAEQKEQKAADDLHEKVMNETFGQDRTAITENGKKFLAANLPANVVPLLKTLDDKSIAVLLAATDSIAKKFGQEDNFRGGGGTPPGGGAETKEVLEGQMREIMGQKEYQDPLMNKTKHAELQAKMEVIRGKLRKIV